MTMQINNVKLVLLDIEGTICSISFVKETLFPYALKALPKVVEEKWDDAEFKQYRDAFPQETRSSPDALRAHVEDLTKRDVKVAYLKNLQGYLWQSGYESGAYATPLFPDVLPELEQWQSQGAKLCIFSSGSVFAQKLLFQHVAGSTITRSAASSDKTGMISGWFDTVNGGPKTEAASYRKIAEASGKATSNVLFLSDNVKEIAAALEAGMKAIVVDRPGNAPLTEEDRKTYQIVDSLDQISIGR